MAPTMKAVSTALQKVPVWLVYAVGFGPAILFFTLGVMDRLGADPMRTLERELGLWALRFLIAGLCVTPLRQVLGLNLLRFRRSLGLLAFWYAVLHLATYTVLDQGLDWAAIGADILKRPYITIGMASLVVLVPLAVTSNNASIRRLGPRWNKLHKLVYAAAAGGALHYLLLVKSWPLEPLIYAAIVAALLAWRLFRTVRKPVRSRVARA